MYIDVQKSKSKVALSNELLSGVTNAHKRTPRRKLCYAQYSWVHIHNGWFTDLGAFWRGFWHLVSKMIAWLLSPVKSMNNTVYVLGAKADRLSSVTVTNLRGCYQESWSVRRPVGCLTDNQKIINKTWYTYKPKVAIAPTKHASHDTVTKPTVAHVINLQYLQ